MIKEHDLAVLTRDLPEYGLEQGDVGTVVYVYETGGYTVEFMGLDGDTLAIVTLPKDQLRRARRGEILHIRRMATVSSSSDN